MKISTRLGLTAAALLAAVSFTATACTPAAVADTATSSPAASPQLIGGIPATVHPSWIVSVHRDYPPGSGQSMEWCTAELVGPEWVAVNAHCVSEDSGLGIDPAANHLWLRVGSNNSSKGGQVFNAVQVIPYPEWNWLQLDSKGRAGDIALVKLSGYASGQPAVIPSADPAIGTTVRQLGWGRTDPSNTGPEPTQLQQVDTTYAGAGAAAGPCNTNPDAPLAVGENCANAADGYRGGCGGDSGGPEMVRINGRWEIIGGLSRSPGLLPGCGGEADIYTDLPYYAGWLFGVMRGEDPQTAEDYLPGGQATPITHTAPAPSQVVDAMQTHPTAG